MGKKKKAKKVSAKKERYSKFRKEKSSTLIFETPNLSDEQVHERRSDEQRIDGFWRHYRRPPEKFIVERQAKSKR